MPYSLGFSIVLSLLLYLTSPVFAQDGHSLIGKRIFLRCSVCHFIDRPQHKIGPTLQNIINRIAGTSPNYHYSPAMLAAGQKGFRWNKQNLKAYLADPNKTIAGTKMAPIPLKSQEIDDLISYLESQQKDSSL